MSGSSLLIVEPLIAFIKELSTLNKLLIKCEVVCLKSLHPN